MAIVILEYPPSPSPAFNPVVLIVQTPKARYAQLTKDLAATTDEAERAKIIAEMNTLEPNKEQDTLDAIYVEVRHGAEIFGKKVVIQREPSHEGKAEIDLSYILRHAFADTQGKLFEYSVVDYNLYASYSISKNPEELGRTHFIINAVQQLGARRPYPRISLSTQTPHARYAGYPTMLSFLFGSAGMYRFELRRGDQMKAIFASAAVTSIVISTENEWFDELKSYNGLSQTDVLATYPIEEACTPDAPFYVRWINTLGGWNYWMFERREQTLEVGDFTNIQRVATNQNDTQTTVSAAASKVVLTGEDLLDREQYNILSALPLSPRIEWYNEELKVWQVVVIGDDFSSTWSSRNSFGSVGFTFLMPRILTQL